MTLLFDDLPGARERHLQRKYQNLLFADADAITQEALVEARRQDQIEAAAFEAEFRALLEEAQGLPPNAGSDRILALKERLEQAYERAAGLRGDRSRELQALERLIGVVVQAVDKAAGDDPVARGQLAQGALARRIHVALLKHPLIADLLNPESPIAASEIVPTLLCASEDSLHCALDLFDKEQLASLYQDGRRLLESLAGRAASVTEAGDRLLLIEAALRSRGAAGFH